MTDPRGDGLVAGSGDDVLRAAAPCHALPRGATASHASSRGDMMPAGGTTPDCTTLQAPAKPRSNGGDAPRLDPEPTRAPGTQQQYSTRSRQLQCRFERDEGVSAIEEPEAFVAWLLALTVTVRPSSRRQYKAAVRFGLERVRDGAPVAGSRVLLALERLNEPVPADGPTRPAATSALKAKRLIRDDLDRLHVRLSRSRSTYDAALRAYLPAGTATGLRPCEWRTARLVRGTGQAVLIIRNAKATGGRAHGRFRRLVWDDPNSPAVAAIATWLQLLHGPHGRLRRDPVAYEVYIQALRDRIRAVAGALWPKRRLRPTLYTTRHQFAATAKQIYGSVEVAALMGHAHDATAHDHYARPPRSGGGGLPLDGLPRPHLRDVARVRTVFAERRGYLDYRPDPHDAPQP